MALDAKQHGNEVVTLEEESERAPLETVSDPDDISVPPMASDLCPLVPNVDPLAPNLGPGPLTPYVPHFAVSPAPLTPRPDPAQSRHLQGLGDGLTSAAAAVMGSMAKNIMEGGAMMFQQLIEQQIKTKDTMMESTSTTVQVRFL